MVIHISMEILGKTMHIFFMSIIAFVSYSSISAMDTERLLDNLAFTQHARERMAIPTNGTIRVLAQRARSNIMNDRDAFHKFVDPRGISKQEIENVIKNGRCTKGESGTVVFKDAHITVVINPETYRVITVYRNSHKGSPDLTEAKEEIRMQLLRTQIVKKQRVLSRYQEDRLTQLRCKIEQKATTIERHAERDAKRQFLS